MSVSQVVVYAPPTTGLPFLVVTLRPDGSVQAEPFATHGQALARYVEAAAEAHRATAPDDQQA